MEKGQLKEIRAQIKKNTEESQAVAIKAPLQKLYDEVAHLSERLGAYSKAPAPKGDEKRGRGAPKGGTRFNSDILDKLADVCDLLPKLNITGDPELERLAAEAKRKLTKYEVPELKTDNKKREVIKKRADSILKDMGDLL